MEFGVEDTILNLERVGHTSSLMFPRKISDILPEWYFRAPTGDDALKMHCILQGRGYFINEIMSARNRGVSGSWSEKMRESKSKRLEHWEGSVSMWESIDDITQGKYKPFIEQRMQIVEKGLNTNKYSDEAGQALAVKYGQENFDIFIQNTLSYIQEKAFDHIAIFGTANVSIAIYEHLKEGGVRIDFFLDNYKEGLLNNETPIEHPNLIRELDGHLLIIMGVLGEHSTGIEKQLFTYNNTIHILSQQDLNVEDGRGETVGRP